MTFPSNRFTWFEYATSDRPKAQGFYGELFHWQTKPIPVGTGTYELILSGGRSLGAYQAPRTAGAAHWIAYVLVEDAKATVARARAAGGTVVTDVTARGTQGQFAVLTDPQGAPFAVWQPAKVEATDLEGVVGMPCWAELFTTHSAAAVNFYEAIGDFRDEPMPMGPGGPLYHVLASGGAQRAGVMDAPVPGMAPHWKPFIQVANTDETVARATRLGATVVLAPHDVPHVGRSAMFIDPLGASAGILQPAARP